AIKAQALDHLTATQQHQLREAANLIAKAGFDPGEPRDEHGRWTEGGGDGGEPSGVEQPRPAGEHPNAPGPYPPGAAASIGDYRGASNAYTRTSTGDAAGSGDVTASYQLHGGNQAAWEHHGWTPLTFNELKTGGADKFAAAIQAAKAASKHGAAVHAY